jgi:uncharacterized protein (TIGR03086 family)
VFAAVLSEVTPEQLDQPTPCADWDANAVIRHVIGGNQWVLTVAGLEVPALPEGMVEAHAASAAAAHEVFASEDGLTRGYELPFAELPGTAFAFLRSADVFTHAWDLARATGQPTDLDPELAAADLDTARMLMRESLRGPGRSFGAEQPCPEGATTADQLAAFLGRELG